MKILVIGGTGMLGASIMHLNALHELFGTFLGRKPKLHKFFELDITKKNQVKKVIYKVVPDAIIHTAAITNVDLCQKNPDLARKVHVAGTSNLVKIAKKKGTYFIYISTDSVFDGKKGNYTETDTPNPINVYAQTKFEGELEALKYENSCVVRTNIYGYNWLPKESIAEWIIKTLKDGKKIDLFKDVYFSPILVNNLAEILIEVIEKNSSGIYHIASPESITKLEFGRLIAKLYNFNNDLINPISIFDLNLIAPRPLKPTLNCSKVQKVINTKLLNVENGLKLFKEIKTSYYLEYLKNF